MEDDSQESPSDHVNRIDLLDLLDVNNKQGDPPFKRGSQRTWRKRKRHGIVCDGLWGFNVHSLQSKEHSCCKVQMYLSPFCTTRFLQVLRQEHAWLHSKIRGGSSLQNSGSRRPAYRAKKDSVGIHNLSSTSLLVEGSTEERVLSVKDCWAWGKTATC